MTAFLGTVMTLSGTESTARWRSNGAPCHPRGKSNESSYNREFASYSLSNPSFRFLCCRSIGFCDVSPTQTVHRSVPFVFWRHVLLFAIRNQGRDSTGHPIGIYHWTSGQADLLRSDSGSLARKDTGIPAHCVGWTVRSLRHGRAPCFRSAGGCVHRFTASIRPTNGLAETDAGGCRSIGSPHRCQRHCVSSTAPSNSLDGLLAASPPAT